MTWRLSAGSGSLRQKGVLHPDMADRPWPGADPHVMEAGVSGSVPLSERPQGRALLTALQAGDAVITAKLHRMFRSALVSQPLFLFEVERL